GSATPPATLPANPQQQQSIRLLEGECSRIHLVRNRLSQWKAGLIPEGGVHPLAGSAEGEEESSKPAAAFPGGVETLDQLVQRYNHSMAAFLREQSADFSALTSPPSTLSSL